MKYQKLEVSCICTVYNDLFFKSVHIVFYILLEELQMKWNEKMNFNTPTRTCIQSFVISVIKKSMIKSVLELLRKLVELNEKVE